MTRTRDGRRRTGTDTGTRTLAVALAALLVTAGLAVAALPVAAATADGPLSVDVRCTADGADLVVENVADRAVELRDIDSAGQDVLSGRPLLAPGGTTTLSGVGDGPVVLAAFDPDSGDRIGEPVHLTVDCADGDDGDGDGPLSVDVRCTAEGADLLVENVGDREIELRDLDAEGQDVLDGRLDLSPGETTTLSGVGDGPVALAAFDPESGERVGEPVRLTVDCGEAFFDVSNVFTGSSTTAGDEFDVDATVTNVGDATGTRTVELRFDDAVVATRELTLSPGESLAFQFVLPGEQTIDFEPERFYTVTVDSGDDAESTEKFVLAGERAFFAVSSVGTGSSTTAGDEFDVSATVTNVGGVAGTRTVELRFDDAVVATEEVTLAPGESVDLEFVLPGEQTIDFEPNRSYTVTVDSGDDAESTEKFVLPP